MKNSKPEPRSIVVKTRLSASERSELDAILARTNMTQAEYLRCAIFGTPVQEAPKASTLDGLDALIAQYGKIGSNLNQIARWLNGGGYLDREQHQRIDHCIGELNQLKFKVLKLAGDYYGNHQTHRQ